MDKIQDIFAEVSLIKAHADFKTDEAVKMFDVFERKLKEINLKDKNAEKEILNLISEMRTGMPKAIESSVFSQIVKLITNG